MKIMTIGDGFIASHLPYEKIPLRVDINNVSNTRHMFSHYWPHVLINCVGFCGIPNIDQCEKEKNKTYTANTLIPIKLAEICQALDIHMIHIGSGCIFSGESPNLRTQWEQDQILSNYEDLGWKEEDFANPQSFYSKTKYSADLILDSMPNTTILRIRMPVSEKNSPRNLINKLRGYENIIDIPNSMTFMTDLVRCIDWIANNKINGTFHVTNPQPLTAARIMQEYQKYVPEHQFKIITEKQLDKLTLAKRSNCLLNCKKLVSAGFQMTNSEEALAKCISSYMQNIKK